MLSIKYTFSSDALLTSIWASEEVPVISYTPPDVIVTLLSETVAPFPLTAIELSKLIVQVTSPISSSNSKFEFATVFVVSWTVVFVSLLASVVVVVFEQAIVIVHKVTTVNNIINFFLIIYSKIP